MGTYPGQPDLSNSPLWHRYGHRRDGLVPRGPAGTHPLALHRARHLVVVQVPLEFGRHGLYRREKRLRAREEKPGGEAQGTTRSPAPRLPPAAPRRGPGERRGKDPGTGGCNGPRGGRCKGSRYPAFARPRRSAPALPVPRGPLAMPRQRHPTTTTHTPHPRPAHRAPLRAGPAGNGRYNGGGGESAVPSTASALRPPRRAPSDRFRGGGGA